MNNVKLGFIEDFIIHKKIKHYKYVEDIINNFTDKQLENMPLDFLQDLEKVSALIKNKTEKKSALKKG